MPVLNTEKYKQRKYDLAGFKSKIPVLALVIVVLCAAALIPVGWVRGIAAVGGIAVALFVIQGLYMLSVCLQSGKSMICCRPATGSAKKDGYDDTPIENPGIRIIGERIGVNEMDSPAIKDGTKTWEVKTYFTVYNQGLKTIRLFDMHARSYCLWYELVPDVSLTIKGRQEVSLSADNSILHERKVFEIEPGDCMAFTLAMEVSRDPDDGWTMAVFGVFADFHEPNGVGSICCPVDCVFCFLNLPANENASGRNQIDAFHVNKANIGRLWEQHYLNPPWRRVMKVLDASLEMQLTNLRRHV